MSCGRGRKQTSAHHIFDWDGLSPQPPHPSLPFLRLLRLYSFLISIHNYLNQFTYDLVLRNEVTMTKDVVMYSFVLPHDFICIPVLYSAVAKMLIDSKQHHRRI